MEEVIMNVILNAGNARSKCFLALKAARKKDFNLTDDLMKEVNNYILTAHKAQTHLIQDEARGNTQPVSLLMVHAQDHLMTAMAIRDMSVEMIGYIKENEAAITALKGEK